MTRARRAPQAVPKAPVAAPKEEPTVALPASLAGAVYDLLAQIPSGQCAGLFLAFHNAAFPQLQAIKDKGNL